VRVLWIKRDVAVVGSLECKQKSFEAIHLALLSVGSDIDGLQSDRML
jgi:hypothetical protein